MLSSSTSQVKRHFTWSSWPEEPATQRYPPSTLALGAAFHPELEDLPRIVWGLKQSEKELGSRATIDVLHGRGTQLEWQYKINDKELQYVVSKEKGLSRQNTALGDHSNAYFKAFFINTLESNYSWLPGNFSIPASSLCILQEAGLSNAILTAIFSPTGAWATMGSRRLVTYNEDGTLDSYGFAYRYVCGWDVGRSFTQFLRTRNCRTYFCINYPTSAREQLALHLKQTPTLIYREFFIDALAAAETLRRWRDLIAQRRESLFAHERKYDDENIDFSTAPRELHRLTRDWHTLSQDCSDMATMFEFLRKTSRKYIKDVSAASWPVDKSSNTDESFEIMGAEVENLVRWTGVYRDRTNLRINLLFHLTNQRESRTSTSIASSTAKVAEQTQRDSASMITIAAVTMLFLPGTFVSAILSTTFFEFGAEGLNVSSQWWILLAVSLPLTVVVFGIWGGWRRWRLEQQRVDVGIVEERDRLKMEVRQLRESYF
ncbi:hypothetical protein BDV96DRAFT_693097 [Lophiotrema nucula]|uniref:Uncharacterized protein n=1 Tax=Lophiotrema nucula TaxID=690887 RepID=A0A6A5YNV6_9PLEO|nr:hypothetical protein BDV96DRAFT_693097 [Lophiotrema nucula]